MAIPSHASADHPRLPTDLEFVRVLSSSEGSTVLLVRRGTRRGVLRIGPDAEVLRTEVALFSRLDTPGLVAPEEWGSTPDGSPYVLRPYVEGAHFADAVRGADVEQVAAWTQALLSTCTALHRAGFVHRDIKSSNVIVRDAETYLIDLDLMSEVGAASSAGTLHHTAPEVLLGGAHTEASDLFSVGAMLAIAFCGAPSPEFRSRFPYRPFWDAAQLDPERVPGELRTLVRSLVRRHPKDRPPSAAHAATQLPSGGASLLPVLGMPFLFGRESVAERLSRTLRQPAPAILLTVEDPAEVEPIREEIALRLALSDRPTRSGPKPPVPIRIEDTTEGALLSLRQSLLGREGCVVIVADSLGDSVLAALEEEFEPEERKRFSAHAFSKPGAAAVEQHLLAISGRSSPTTARSLARSLVQRTGGALSRLNRCLRRSVEAGVLRALSSSFVLLRDEWPTTLGDGVNAETLGGLSREARRLLLCLHVLGERGAANTLDELAQLDPDTMARAWSELHEKGVTRPGTTRTGLPLLIDSTLLDAAAAAGSDQLAALHRSALELFRARGAGDDELIPHLAHCAADAPERALVLEAARARLEAGHLASARGLVQNLERHLAGNDPDPEQLLRLELELDIGQGNAAEGLNRLRQRFGDDLARAHPETWVAAARALEQCGERERARELYSNACSHATASATRARAALGMAYGLWLDGRADECLEFITGLPKKRDPLDVAGAIHNLRAGALAHQGRHAEAHAELDLALVCSRRAKDPTLLGRTELNRAYTLRREGRSPEALEALARAADAFDEADHLKLRSLAINNRGVLHRDLGELRAANECLHQALELRRLTGDAHGIAVTTANLGFVALDSGELGSALEQLERARVRCERGGYRDELRFVELHRAVALALAGETKEAHVLLQSVETRIPDARPLLSAFAQAQVELARGNEERAVRVLERSVKLNATHDDGADRLRVARLWLALRPDDVKPARELRAAVDRLPSRVRLAEAEWALRPRHETPSETLLQVWLEEFENAGRTDLVAMACRLLARAHDSAGRTLLRRRLMVRARSTEDVLLDGLSPESRDLAAARIQAFWKRELEGAEPPTARSAGMNSEWLLSWNRRLAQEKDLEELTLATLERAREVTAAERGFLVILDGEEIEVHVASGLDLETTPEAELHFSRTVVRRAIETGAPVVAADAAADPRFAAAKSVRSMELRSVLCVPLPAMDGLDGALYLDCDSRQSMFDEFDAEAVRALSDQAAIAVLNLRRQQEVIRLNERLSDQLASRENELTRVRSALRDRGTVAPVGELVGNSEVMQELFASIVRLAPTDLPVFLWGPRGSEITLVARALHDRSRRARGPFLTQNLSALPADAIEDELFGHTKGTYGSGRNRLGLLSKAERGTLFLDGIEELPANVQKKLLDALETGTYRAAGSHKERTCDVRLVTSSRADLTERMDAEQFLPDLYHLIDAAEIEIPSLQDRTEDLPLLIRHCTEQLNQKHGTRKTVSDGVVAALVRRPWPGELRELVNEITRLYFVSEDSIDRTDWVRTPGRSARTTDTMPASYRLEDVERAAVARALEASGNNKGKTARLLGVSRAGLYKKLKRLGLDGPGTAQ